MGSYGDISPVFRMESSPLASRPKSAIPSHLLNGHLNMEKPSLRTSISAKERDRLTDSIASSGKRIQSADPGEINGQYPYRSDNTPMRPSDLQIEARDARDEALTTPIHSRPASPYTLNPPIDFDGLSWPS